MNLELPGHRRGADVDESLAHRLAFGKGRIDDADAGVDRVTEIAPGGDLGDGSGATRKPQMMPVRREDTATCRRIIVKGLSRRRQLLLWIEGSLARQDDDVVFFHRIDTVPEGGRLAEHGPTVERRVEALRRDVDRAVLTEVEVEATIAGFGRELGRIDAHAQRQTLHGICAAGGDGDERDVTLGLVAR